MANRTARVKSAAKSLKKPWKTLREKLSIIIEVLVRNFILLLLAALPLSVNAQIFKCVTSDGRTQFSQVPCPPDAGNSVYYGTAVKTPEGADAPSSDEVIQRNLRAAQIMRGDNQPKSPQLTIVPDNTVGKKADRERQARREARNAAGGEKRIRVHCNSLGNTSFCRDSEGGRHVSDSIGNTTFTKSTDKDGNTTRITTTE